MMAALVQSFPTPSTSTMTMLQSRSASSEPFQNPSQGQQHPRNSQTPRNIYNTSVGGMVAGTYRGQTSASPVSTYAFSSTPTLASGQNPLRQHPTATHHPRMENRASSAPSLPALQSTPNTGISSRPRLPVESTASAPLNSQNSSPHSIVSSDPLKDLSSLNPANSRPLSAIDLGASALSYANVAKSSPDRYKRNHQRSQTPSGLSSSTVPVSPGGSAVPSGSGMATVGHLYNHPAQSSSTPTLSSYNSYRGTVTAQHHARDAELTHQPRLASKDDMNLHQQSSSEPAKRYRRRSISSLEAKEFGLPASETGAVNPQAKTYAATLAAPAPSDRKDSRSQERPSSSHRHNGSAESSVSSRSGPSSGSAKRGPELQRGPDIASSSPIAQNGALSGKTESRTVHVPVRGSSETNKRLMNPSPLSHPVPTSPEAAGSSEGFSESSNNATVNSTIGIPESPAAQQLAALNKKDGKKEGKSSRLRRAFSFGSASELRKASVENNAHNASMERAKLKKAQSAEEEDAQQAAIAQRQEASGLGESIYSGQGNFFTGSTDNLSISSTASSASVMIRKMGKGVKKGSRSLVGLFRPKSVVGVPAAEPSAPEPSVAQVSMVTVEAEREKVNVNANPHDHPGGGTGFPKLERNSLDASSVAQELAPAFSDRDTSIARRSIVGGERERAEVLAAVKKGILKRSGTDSGNSSPVVRPVDAKSSDLNPPAQRPHDSPRSASPSPISEHVSRAGHRRTDSIHIEGDDYFMSLQNYANGESRSNPGTPRSIARNISFSPRIIFHDTWPSGEYDRRGEIATCNRLTPMLAQQIKEELNTFKMEMEVHTESKVYTHFF